MACRICIKNRSAGAVANMIICMIHQANGVCFLPHLHHGERVKQAGYRSAKTIGNPEAWMLLMAWIRSS